MSDKKLNSNQSVDSTLRKHYYLNDYVVIAPHRQKRPDQLSSDVVGMKTAPHHPIEDSPSLYEVSATNSTGWSVKVVKNAYPAFSASNPGALGQQEVVLETAKVNTRFHELSANEIKQIFVAYRSRVSTLRREYSYISIFKNQGHNAGASLAHTHSQIIATDIIPPQVEHDRQVLSNYQSQHQTSALCDVIRWELQQKERVIAHTRFTTSICPYASQYPLETWIIPNRQVQTILDLNDDELMSLASHLKGIATALASKQLDYNYHLQESVNGLHNHFYIKVTPRLNIQAGFEINTGIYINPISPEKAKTWYEKYVKIPDVS